MRTPRLICATSISAFILALGSHSTPAADIFWGGNVDGAFVTPGNWFAEIEHLTLSAGVPGAADRAVFNANGTIANPITSLGGPVGVDGLLFNSNVASAITITDTNKLTLGAQGITVNAAVPAPTFALPVDLNATQAWTHNGTGTLTISGNVIQGVGAGPADLTLGGTGAFNFGGLWTQSGASRTITIDTPAAVTFNNINLSETNTGRTLTFGVNSAAPVTVGGVIQNGGTAGGGVTKTGTGTLTFSAANTFSGTLTINDGTVIADAGNATSNPPLTFDGTGTTPRLTTNGNYRVGSITSNAGHAGAVIDGTGALVLNGGRTFTVNDSGAANDLTIGVAIRNQAGGGGTTAQTLTKAGAGTLVLNGANDFSGTFTINEGNVVVNASQPVAGGVTFGGTGASTLTTGRDAIAANGNSASSVVFRLGGNLQVNSTSGPVLLDGQGSLGLFGTRVFIANDGTGADDLTIRVPIVDGDATLRSWRKEGLGRLVIQGNNTNGGFTELFRGETVLDYSLNNGNKLPDAVNLAFRGGGLVLSANSSAASTESMGVGNFFRVQNGWNPVTVLSNNGQTMTFNISGINRAIGEGLVDFRSANTTLAKFVTTSTANAQTGIFGAFATFNSDRWATMNGAGEIVAAGGLVASDRAAWLDGSHIIVDGALTGALSASRLQSVIFDAAVANTLAVDNRWKTLNLETGGVLASADVGLNNTVISGGQIRVPGRAGNSSALVATNLSTGLLEINSSISGSGTPLSLNQEVTVGGPGLVLLSGKNSFDGDINIHGTLRVAGGAAIGDYAGVNLQVGGGSVLELNGTTETVGNLIGGTFTNKGNATIDLGTGGKLIFNQVGNTSYSGGIIGSGTLVKQGGATLTTNSDGTANAWNFTGDLEVHGGLIAFTNNAPGAVNVSNILVRGGQIQSQQNDGGTLNKFSDTAAIRLEGTVGSGLRVNSNQNAGRTETVSGLVLGAGANTVSVFNNNAASSDTRLDFTGATAFTRERNATMLVRGGNLGAANSTLGRSRVTFANSVDPLLVGAGGSAGSTTISILPFAVGELNSSAGVGNTFVTNGTTGLRPLDVATEYASDFAAAGATANVSLSADASGPGKTINALRIDSSAANVTLTGAGAGNTLTVTSGAILATAGANTNAATVGGFDQILAGAAGSEDDELVTWVTSSNATPGVASLTISSAIANNGGATHLTKSGGGTLVLGGTNTYSGTTTINEGVLQFSAANNIGADGPIRLAGGTLQFGTGNTADISITAGNAARTVELLGASVYLNPFAGGNILTAGSAIDTGDNAVTLANAIGNGAAGGLRKLGSGTLTLQVAPTYKGTTRVQQGAMNFATIAPNTISGLFLAADSGDVNSTIASGLNLRQLVVGGVFTGTANSTGSLVVNGGAVNIGDGAGDSFLLVGFRSTAAGGGVAGGIVGSANFQNAASVNVNVDRIALGANYTGSGSNSTRGDLLLSGGANTITANQILAAHSVSPGNTGVTSTIQLGDDANVFNVNTFVIGGQKSVGRLQIAPGGSFTLRGRDGGDNSTNLHLGDNDIGGTGTTGTNSVGTIDLTGAAAVDMRLNYLVLGRVSGSNSTTAGSGSGILTFGTGTVEANVIRMADANYISGSNNFNAGTQGTINLNGGTLRFEQMSAGKGTAIVNWAGGTISNVAGRDLTNSNVNISVAGTDPHNFNVDAGRLATLGADAGFTGTGTVTKTGAGTLVLDGASNHVGATVVAAGTLDINGSISGSTVDVRAGALLRGDGSIAGDVSIASGGSLVPDSLAVTGNLTIGNGAKLQLELNGLNAGSGYSQLTLDGPTTAFTLGGTSLIEATVGGTLPGGSLLFVGVNNTGNPISGMFSNAPQGGIVTFSGQDFLVSYTGDVGTSSFAGSGNDLVLQVVPEPGSAVTLISGLGMLLGLRRFRSRVIR